MSGGFIYLQNSLEPNEATEVGQNECGEMVSCCDRVSHVEVIQSTEQREALSTLRFAQM